LKSADTPRMWTARSRRRAPPCERRPTLIPCGMATRCWLDEKRGLGRVAGDNSPRTQGEAVRDLCRMAGAKPVRVSEHAVVLMLHWAWSNTRPGATYHTGGRQSLRNGSNGRPQVAVSQNIVPIVDRRVVAGRGPPQNLDDSALPRPVPRALQDGMSGQHGARRGCCCRRGSRPARRAPDGCAQILPQEIT
jgi:hypothetical protein